MNGIRKRSVLVASALFASFASLGGCVPDPYSQVDGHTTNTQPVNYAPTAPLPVTYAPTAPPAPLVEVVPSPPGPTVTWQPGNWAWTGSQWAWIPGHYEQRPAQAGVWLPGHWEQNSNGYFWIAGRWQ